jgi:hypothetical protein
MAGLDPAIQLSPKGLAKRMDARVKPAHDESNLVAAPALQRTTPQARRAALRPGNAAAELTKPVP